MDGFQKDYHKLFQLFKSESRVACSHLHSDQSETSAPTTHPQSTNDDIAGEDQVVAYNFSFGQFIKCFEKMKFAYIFCGHRSSNSIREFFDEISIFILDKLSTKNSIEKRIFSFYLLYALWFVQLKTYKYSLKIRIDRNSYIDIQNLVKESFERKQIDIVVAYRKLFLSGAFLFCQNIQLYGPYFKDYLSKINKTEAKTSNQENSTYFAELNQNLDSYVSQLVDSVQSNSEELKCDNLVKLIEQFEKLC